MIFLILTILFYLMYQSVGYWHRLIDKRNTSWPLLFFTFVLIVLGWMSLSSDSALYIFPKFEGEISDLNLRLGFISVMLITMLMSLAEKNTKIEFYREYILRIFMFFILVRTNNYFWWTIALISIEFTFKDKNVALPSILFSMIAIYLMTKMALNDHFTLVSLIPYGDNTHRALYIIFLLLTLVKLFKRDNRKSILYLRNTSYLFILLVFQRLATMRDLELLCLNMAAFTVCLHYGYRALLIDDERSFYTRFADFSFILAFIFILNNVYNVLFVLILIILPTVIFIDCLRKYFSSNLDKGALFHKVLFLILLLPTPLSPLLYILNYYVTYFIENKHYSILLLISFALFFYIKAIIQFDFVDLIKDRYVKGIGSLKKTWPFLLFSLMGMLSILFFLPPTLSSNDYYALNSLLEQKAYESTYDFSTLNIIFLSILMFSSVLIVLVYVAVQKKDFSRFDEVVTLFFKKNNYSYNTKMNFMGVFYKIPSIRESLIKWIDFIGKEIFEIDIDNIDKKIAVTSFWLILVLIFLIGGISL